MTRLLVVEDEAPIREALAYSFRREGYAVITADDCGDCLQKARLENPHLIILDVMLPTGSGFDLCRTLRAESSVPIILLTARTDEFDRLLGLELGADDYVTKPFSVRELMARARALLRRTESENMASEKSIPVEGLTIQPSTRRVMRAGVDLALSPRAATLLCFLAANPGRVFTRETLLSRVWGHDAYVTERTVDVHVRWIREKIEEDPANPRFIQTIRGIGYRFRG